MFRKKIEKKIIDSVGKGLTSKEKKAALKKGEKAGDAIIRLFSNQQHTKPGYKHK